MRADTGRACGSRCGDTRPNVVPLRHEFRVLFPPPNLLTLIVTPLPSRPLAHPRFLVSSPFWSPLYLLLKLVHILRYTSYICTYTSQYLSYDELRCHRTPMDRKVILSSKYSERKQVISTLNTSTRAEPNEPSDWLGALRLI